MHSQRHLLSRANITIFFKGSKSSIQGDSVTFQDSFELLPFEAPPLAPSVEPFIQRFHRLFIELIQVFKISYQPIIVVVTSQLSVQLQEQSTKPVVPVLPAPIFKGMQGLFEFQCRCSPFDY